MSTIAFPSGRTESIWVSTLMDNFECAYGHAKRYGILAVDTEPRRILKGERAMVSICRWVRPAGANGGKLVE